ncbi:MAG TPA: immune inhibitor A domain-containing protein, partial [Phycicoccus sp.]|nr:immune inhibitor A domain-containing protein [Phycicoccus sp.]
MRRITISLVAAVAATATSLLGVSNAAAGAAASAQPPDSGFAKGRSDSLPNPKADKQAAQRALGKQMQLAGKIPQDAKVGKVAKGQYVELAREGEDSIWSVLGEFGNQVSPTYGGTAGPQRNQIPQPDRTVDNSTIWAPDFTPAYYSTMLFSDAPGAVSMRNFYKEQSSNRYTVNGDVTDWTQVPFNEAYYGSNYCGGIVCARTWLFVRDSVNAWYNAQVAAGKSQADIEAYLAKFDVWDRYDYDHDGNFNEPDGYIDHFQSIHAGEGEETGGG